MTSSPAYHIEQCQTTLSRLTRVSPRSDQGPPEAKTSSFGFVNPVPSARGISKKNWLDAINRWQKEWKDLADETGIVATIGGIHELVLVSDHGINGPADLRLG